MSSMKKLILTAGVVAFASTAVLAQDVSYYFSARQYRTAGLGFLDSSPAAGIQAEVLPPNSPTQPYPVSDAALGNVPIMYIEPSNPPAPYTGLVPAPLNNLAAQLWMSVGTKYTGANSEQLASSMGLDVSPVLELVSPNPGTSISRRATISSTLTLYTAQAQTNSAGAQLWDGVNLVSPPLTDARGVTVPDSVGDFAVGAVPTTAGTPGAAAGSASYRVATMNVTGGGGSSNGGGGTGGAYSNAVCRGLRPTRYNVSLLVGNVLITRAVNPAFGGALSPENVAFGYAGATAVPEVAGSGSAFGTTSATPDLRIEVRIKGDFNGDGTVNASDNAAYTSARDGGAATSPLNKFLGDFNNDGAVNAADNSNYTSRRDTFGQAARLANCLTTP